MRFSFLVLACCAACSPFHHLPVNDPPEALSVISYTCEKEQQILVAYDNSDTISRAYVKVVGKTAFTRMEITKAASGARYANDQLVWWTGTGGEGFLEVSTPDWDGKILVRECRISTRDSLLK